MDYERMEPKISGLKCSLMTTSDSCSRGAGRVGEQIIQKSLMDFFSVMELENSSISFSSFPCSYVLLSSKRLQRVLQMEVIDGMCRYIYLGFPHLPLLA